MGIIFTILQKNKVWCHISNKNTEVFGAYGTVAWSYKSIMQKGWHLTVTFSEPPLYTFPGMQKKWN